MDRARAGRRLAGLVVVALAVMTDSNNTCQRAVADFVFLGPEAGAYRAERWLAVDDARATRLRTVRDGLRSVPSP